MAHGRRTRGASRPRRWSWAGGLVGAALPFPAAVLALGVPAVERLAPLLVPGAVLLRPLSSALAEQNGAVNVLLVSAVNGLLFAAVAGGVALVVDRRRGRRRLSTQECAVAPSPGRLRLALATVLAAAVLVVLGAGAVSARAERYAEQAAQDLPTVALDAGFDAAGDVRVRYPFLVERLGLVARNEQPFPYGYATVDLELDGCRLEDVFASVTPDTRRWLPRRISLHGVRFSYEYLEPGTSAAPGSFQRVEFRTAPELLDRLAETVPGGAMEEGHLCRLQPSDGQGGPGPGPALSPAPADPPTD